jgi:hypothetical protein
MKFEPDIPDCSWITHQLTKGSFEIQIWGFFPNICLKIQMGKTTLEFFFSLPRIDLTTELMYD